jgi:hypothetical protein
MTEDAPPYLTRPQVVPHGAPTLTARELVRAKVRIAWDFLSQVAEQADLLPSEARPHVAQGLASITQAKAVVESMREQKERTS